MEFDRAGRFIENSHDLPWSVKVTVMGSFESL